MNRSRLFDTFDHEYERGEVIGQGGEGSVYLCKKRSTGRVLVAKHNRYIKTVHGELKEKFILHNHLAARNFLVAYEADVWDPFASESLLILEHCDAGSLANLIDNHLDRDRYILEPFVWHVFQQMANALAYIHKEGIIHRDVKPDNMLLTWYAHGFGIRSKSSDYPFVKLADFGLAGVVTDPKFRVTAPEGTPDYQPPEIPLASYKCDVWGLGATIHEMMHLCRPFPKGYDSWGLRSKVLCDPNGAFRVPYIKRSTHYSKQLNEVMGATLAWQPIDRIRSCALANKIRQVRPYRVAGDFKPLPGWATQPLNVNEVFELLEEVDIVDLPHMGNQLDVFTVDVNL